MNQSNVLLIESKWNKFLKESTNSDIDLDDLVDDIMNNQRPFAPRKETPTKDRVDKRIAAIKKQKQPLPNKSPEHFNFFKDEEDEEDLNDILKQMGFDDESDQTNDILDTNVELIIDRFSYHYSKNGLRQLSNFGELDDTPLAKIPLKKFLGAGSFAVAYEDSDGHVIKCGELRPGNSTEKAFYRKYLKKPSKNFIVHYYKTFKTSDCEMYLAITNKFLTFYEYAQFIIASKSNQRTYTMDRYGYPSFLSAITSEIGVVRHDLVNALPKVRNSI